MIYTLTLNPALDYVMDVENIVFNSTNRSSFEGVSFGGKGINVSVVLSRLGISTTALGFAAGFTGKELEKAISLEGINADFTELSSGMTRINVKLNSGGSITEINSSGPKVEESDLRALYVKFDEISSGDTLVLAGSIPKGADSGIYSDIMSYLSDKNIRFVVDATGKALLETLKYKPFLIKPNRDELQDLFGVTLSDDEQIIGCATKLKNMGAQNVLVSLGKDGAILLDGDGNLHKYKSHKITPKNTVGAGDSMVAGFIAGVDKGYEYALRLGIASGAATAASETLAQKDEILKFMDEWVD
ncbi:MAG: 1-phosphofructokinase [Clostridia bacterium]|nr:1-phosphofructokinase [Clostridia bacterium]